MANRLIWKIWIADAWANEKMGANLTFFDSNARFPFDPDTLKDRLNFPTWAFPFTESPEARKSDNNRAYGEIFARKRRLLFADGQTIIARSRHAQQGGAGFHPREVRGACMGSFRQAFAGSGISSARSPGGGNACFWTRGISRKKTWLLKCIGTGEAAGVANTVYEEKVFTNFVR